MHRTKIVSALACATMTVACLALVACSGGSSGDGDDTDPTVESAVATTNPPDAFTEASTPDAAAEADGDEAGDSEPDSSDPGGSTAESGEADSEAGDNGEADSEGADNGEAGSEAGDDGEADNGEATSTELTDTESASDAPVGDFEVPNGGQIFTDPNGKYRMAVSNAWDYDDEDRPSTQNAEVWFLPDPSTEFNPNVNVLLTPSAGMSLQEFTDFSVQSAPSFDYRQAEIVTGPNGNELALFDYVGVVPGAPNDEPLHFLRAVVMRGEEAVVATMTSQEEDFTRHRAQVEPFLLTLEAL